MTRQIRRKSPFFLLEVMIAVILVGIFSYFSLQSAFKTLNIHRKFLRELEYSRLTDLKRMEVIEAYWNKARELFEAGQPVIVEKGPLEYKVGRSKAVLASQQKYVVQCNGCRQEKFYLLDIKEKRAQPPKEITYHFFVTSP